MCNVKRLLALLCIVALLVTGLCACAQKPADSQKDSAVKTEEPAADNDSKAEGDKTDETPSGQTVMVGSEGSISADEFGYEATPARKYTIAVVVKSAAIPVWESHIVAAKLAWRSLTIRPARRITSKNRSVSLRISSPPALMRSSLHRPTPKRSKALFRILSMRASPSSTTTQWARPM